MRSLQARLGMGLFLSLVLVFAALWFGVSGAIRYLAEDYIASRLAHDAETLLSAVSFTNGTAPLIDAARIDAIYRQPFSGHYYQIDTANGTLYSRSLWDQQLVMPVLDPGQHRLTHLDGPRAQPLLAWTAAYRKQDVAVTILVAEDLSMLENDIGNFQQRFAVTALLLLIVLIVIQALIVRSSLRPLEALQREVQALERGERDTLGTAVPREVEALVREFNHLLAVIGERLGRYRNALGDLAHALKRPLTVLQQLRNDANMAQHPALAATLAEQVDSMQRTIERILQRARLAGHGPVGAHLSIRADVPALVDALSRMYRDKHITLEPVPGSADTLPLDREDMLELLGNLLENACQWANSAIRLRVKHSAHEVCFVVEDDGPGIEDGALPEVMQRGVRADESKAGHGLGLAIAAEIAAHYSGSLRLSRSQDLGGLLAEVHIPLHKAIAQSDIYHQKKTP